MAQQRFSNAFRDALWQAHGKKCIHCTVPLMFMDMELDHIVPERLIDDPAALKSLLDSMGIAEGFNIQGYENLGPSCKSCNNKKAGGPFPPGYAVIILQRISGAIPKLKKLLAEKREEQSLDSVLRLISRSLENATFSEEALNEGLAKIIYRVKTSVEEPGMYVTPLGVEVEHPTIPTLLWSRHAQERMIQRGMSVSQLKYIIQASIENGALSGAMVDQGKTFELSASDFTFCFNKSDDKLMVKTVYWAGGGRI